MLPSSSTQKQRGKLHAAEPAGSDSQGRFLALLTHLAPSATTTPPSTNWKLHRALSTKLVTLHFCFPPGLVYTPGTSCCSVPIQREEEERAGVVVESTNRVALHICSSSIYEQLALTPSPRALGHILAVLSFSPSSPSRDGAPTPAQAHPHPQGQVFALLQPSQEPAIQRVARWPPPRTPLQHPLHCLESCGQSRCNRLLGQDAACL